LETHGQSIGAEKLSKLIFGRVPGEPEQIGTRGRIGLGRIVLGGVAAIWNVGIGRDREHPCEHSTQFRMSIGKRNAAGASVIAARKFNEGTRAARASRINIKLQFWQIGLRMAFNT
jgi:hypothetical protein